MKYPFPLLYPEQHPAEATLDRIVKELRSHQDTSTEKVLMCLSMAMKYFDWQAAVTPRPQTAEQQEFDRVAALMEEDTRSIFVFGSNLAGRHGAGAAKTAIQRYGAIYGQGEGLQGRSYAIPTKDDNIEPLRFNEVIKYVNRFKQFAELAPEMTFAVTKIGCGLAGFTEDEIRPLFQDAPVNCELPIGWRS